MFVQFIYVLSFYLFFIISHSKIHFRNVFIMWSLVYITFVERRHI